MSYIGVIAIDSEPDHSVKFRIGSQRRRTWEPEQEYPRPRYRRKLGRRASSVVSCLWGDRIGKCARRRSESFSDRQTYRRLSWKSLDISVITPHGSIRRDTVETKSTNGKLGSERCRGTVQTLKPLRLGMSRLGERSPLRNNRREFTEFSPSILMTFFS
ncbi:unnamed protein product [Larinioides sclopetarius]|uniref:Uncharacterized protein n=1 Tax=Larinioides sclopetarius TaxID=280406 RepID=A0AAV2BNC8_9ARAC